ncbi:hypothetical protein [Sporosarcina sp. ZBG7A]|nr:hypothetical protein [Sporosarcina sp. ZBG7A]
MHADFTESAIWSGLSALSSQVSAESWLESALTIKESERWVN